ncbi:NAD(+) synthase [Spirochaetota bacterium]
MMITDFSKPVENIRKELEEYIVRCGIKSLVIGISGGIDSAICSVLALPVCEKLGIPLIGRSIAIETNKEDEIVRAKKIGAYFCTDFKEVDLTDFHKGFIGMLKVEEGQNDGDDYSLKIRHGNIKARIRMIYLYDLANKNSGMVLSTDNKTELLVGFWTLHGDVGDYGMIQNLWKTEVYAMARYLAGRYDGKMEESITECIDAIPTDGLGITSSDFDQLGVKSYDECDMILKDYAEEGNNRYKDHPVISRHRRTGYKRMNPFNIPRDKIFK